MATAIQNRQNAPECVATMSNLRNGAVGVITQVAPRGTIPEAYYWLTVTGITPANCTSVLDVLFKEYVVRLGNTPNAREIALILAVARTVAIKAWHVAVNEVAAAESAASHIEITAAAAQGQWTVVDTDAAIVPILAVAPLTALELSYVPYLAWMATPVIALQGLSLVETNHHYIAATYRYFSSTKDQVVNAGSVEFKQWALALGAILDDALFHKALHPINVAVKVTIAKQIDTSARLVAAGCTAAAIRLPASPGEVKAARAALTVMARASSNIVAMGGSVDLTILSAAIAAVVNAADEAATRTAVAALTATLEARKPSIAYCLGVVRAELDAANIAKHTLTDSHFLKRLMKESTSDFNDGVAIYNALKLRTREAIAKGTVTARNIV